jgi:7-cyano-7-deazaguanine synthase
MSKAISIVSGGLDSVTLAHYMDSLGFKQHLVSFDYGQRHKKELQFAAKCAERIGAKHSIVDLSAITNLIGTSALTGDIEVPDGHYAEQTMKITVVPNRNMMMLSIATAIAVAENAQIVATGVHGGDHFIYPDCRAEFVHSVCATAMIGNLGMSENFMGIQAPFVHGDKTDIARRASDLGVPILETWSCYKGGEIHCGSCGTCFERREAFDLAGVPDPTPYIETPDYADPRVRP